MPVIGRFTLVHFQKRLHQTFQYIRHLTAHSELKQKPASGAVAEYIYHPFTKYISLLINKLSFELAENHKFCFKAVSKRNRKHCKMQATHINSVGISD